MKPAGEGNEKERDSRSTSRCTIIQLPARPTRSDLARIIDRSNRRDFRHSRPREDTARGANAMAIYWRYFAALPSSVQRALLSPCIFYITRRRSARCSLMSRHSRLAGNRAAKWRLIKERTVDTCPIADACSSLRNAGGRATAGDEDEPRPLRVSILSRSFARTIYHDFSPPTDRDIGSSITRISLSRATLLPGSRRPASPCDLLFPVVLNTSYTMMNNAISSFFHHIYGTRRATLHHLARIGYPNRNLDAALWLSLDWRKVRGKGVITSMIVQGNFQLNDDCTLYRNFTLSQQHSNDPHNSNKRSKRFNDRSNIGDHG